MKMAVIRRRVCRLSSIPGFEASKSKVSSSSSSFQRAIFDPFPVYGVRRLRLEGEGVPSKQAEAITAATTADSNDNIENVSQSLVSKGEMLKGHNFSLLQHETEKLRNDIEKMHIELRYEIDKATVGNRLHLQLEMRKIREQLYNQNTETNNLTNRRHGQGQECVAGRRNE